MNHTGRQRVRRFRAAWETAATRLGAALIPPLSRPAVLRWADRLGRLAWRADGHLRATGRANLRLALGDTLGDAGRDAILRASYSSFALVLLDVFWFQRDTERRLADWVRFDASAEVLTRDSPQILLTAHLGNWEVMGQALAHRGYPLMSVAAPLANPAVDRLFQAMRTRSGQTVISRDGAVRQLVRHLRRGGKIAMLLDQNTKPSEGGVFVDFFGLPVPVSQAAAVLAIRTRSEIHFGCCLPDDTGSYRAFAASGVPVDELPREARPEQVVALTQRLTGITEDAVRTHPGFWLWTYKRWKHIPPGQPRRHYPFYAKAPAGAGAASNQPER